MRRLKNPLHINCLLALKLFSFQIYKYSLSQIICILEYSKKTKKNIPLNSFKIKINWEKLG